MIYELHNLWNNRIGNPLHYIFFATHSLTFECMRVTQLSPHIAMNKIHTHLFSIYKKLWLLDSYNIECNIRNCCISLKCSFHTSIM